LPTYKVTAPDGRTVRLTGDSPPTEQELEQVFAALPTGASKPTAPISPWQERSVGGMLRNAGQSMLGAVKGAAETAYASNPVTMGSRLAQYATGGQAPQGEAEMIAALQPANEAQAVGRGAERMAEYAAPGGPARGVAGAVFQGARGAATALAQGESLRDAGVTGLISAAGPLTAKLAEFVAPGLKRLAVAQYERALNPTTKPLKATTERIVPELLDRGVVGTLPGLAERGAKESAPVGKALNQAYAGATKAGKEVPTAPIMRKLSKMKERYYVKNKAGESFAANPGAVARIEAVEELVAKFGDAAPPDQLWLLRQNVDDIITASGGFTNDIKHGTAKQLQRFTRNAIQKELNKIDPDLAKLNATFSLWKGLQEVAEASVSRKRGQVGIVESGLRAGLGGGLGALIGEDDRVWGPVGGMLGLATKHPLWRTFSAVNKAKIANALVTGDASAAAATLSRFLASAAGPNAPATTQPSAARP
jgi:hypothetical protein